jgi:hypothetical protein
VWFRRRHLKSIETTVGRGVEVVDYVLEYRINSLLQRLTAEEQLLNLSPPPPLRGKVT